MLAKNIRWLWIVVSDLQKAREFYINVMGFTAYQEVPGVNYLQLKCEDSILMLYQSSQEDREKPG